MVMWNYVSAVKYAKGNLLNLRGIKLLLNNQRIFSSTLKLLPKLQVEDALKINDNWWSSYESLESQVEIEKRDSSLRSE
jgi:hypothetical protein